jgi:biopolymer transport protein ExbD
MMTPLIDVVFQLLIFFVCTASFEAAEELLPTSLVAEQATVAGTTEPEPPPERVVIKIRLADGRVRWLVNEQPYADLTSLDAALLRVAAIDRNVPVTLDAEGAVPLGDVVDVYDRSRLAGFRTIQFAANLPQAK